MIKIYKWKLEILNYESDNGFYFGIDSSKKICLNDSYTVIDGQDKLFYAFSVTNYMIRSDAWIDTHLPYKVGDEVCLILNIEEKTFGIMINNDIKNTAKHRRLLLRM